MFPIIPSLRGCVVKTEKRIVQVTRHYFKAFKPIIALLGETKRDVSSDYSFLHRSHKAKTVFCRGLLLVDRKDISPKMASDSEKTKDSTDNAERTDDEDKNTSVVGNLEDSLLKQKNELQEYRRLQHERWKKNSGKSPNKSKKHLFKEIISSVTAEGNEERSGRQGASTDLADVSVDRNTSKSKRRHSRKKLKRARQPSEGDNLDNKRNNNGLNTEVSCVSPELIDLDHFDGSSGMVQQDLTDTEPAEMELGHSEVERPGPSGVKKTPEETVSKAPGSEPEDEEIECLGVYSRFEDKPVIDLTDSPSPVDETVQENKHQSTESNHTRDKSDTPRSRPSASASKPPSASTDGFGNSDLTSDITRPHLPPTVVGGRGAIRFNINVPHRPRAQHVFPGPYARHHNQPPERLQTPAFTNFLAAAAFGDALLPGFSGVPPIMGVPSLMNHNSGNFHMNSSAAAFHHSSQNSMAFLPSSTNTHSSRSSRKSKKPSKLRSRPWSPLVQLATTRDVMDFTVMSYNVLAQNLLESNSYLYRDSPDEYLNWDYRKQNLLREITEYMPDIICLQEVYDDHFYNFFQVKLLEHGYKGYYKRRTRSNKDGCATFFKESKFSLEKLTPVEYFTPNVYVLDRDNIALILTLRPKVKSPSDVLLIVSNTHLLFNPKRGDVKLAQLMVLLSKIDSLARIDSQSMDPSTPKYHPTILTGDFNTEPKSPIYQFLATGSVGYENRTIAHFSGQQEGMRYGGSRCFDREIIPARMGITDHCQYKNEVMKRIERWKIPSNNSAPSGSGVGRDNNIDDPSTSSHSQANSDAQTLANEQHLTAQCSGTVSTFLPLVSVYRHSSFSSRLNGFEDEATTHHGLANCTVDYIFYSVHSRSTKIRGERVKLKRVKDDRLRLTKRLSLLTEREMAREGSLPNKEVSSDHIALLAGFQLKLA